MGNVKPKSKFKDAASLYSFLFEELIKYFLLQFYRTEVDIHIRHLSAPQQGFKSYTQIRFWAFDVTTSGILFSFMTLHRGARPFKKYFSKNFNIIAQPRNWINFTAWCNRWPENSSIHQSNTNTRLSLVCHLVLLVLVAYNTDHEWFLEWSYICKTIFYW